MTSFEKVIDLFQTSSFKEGFEEYKSKNTKAINEITEFLDCIETNKKYYRIGIQKNKKYRKKQNEDTEDIKNINSLVNKITENNFEIIKNEISTLINKEHLIPYIIETVIEKSILHHRYIKLYVSVLKDINTKNKIKFITHKCDKYYDDFFNKFKVGGSSYEDLCKKNKNIDNIIGLSILITYLEKEKLLLNYVEKVLDPFMERVGETNEEELFKMLTSFYNISQLYYEEIPEKYKEKLVKLKEGKSHKIRFKIMDILDE
jgi:hypothetical protein